MFTILASIIISCDDSTDEVYQEIEDEAGAFYKYSQSTSKPGNKLANPIVRNGGGSTTTEEQSHSTPGLHGFECITSGQAQAYQLIVPQEILDQYPNGYFTFTGAALDSDTFLYNEEIFGFDNDGNSYRYYSSLLYLTLPFRHANETWKIQMGYHANGSNTSTPGVFYGSMILKADHVHCQ